MFCDPILIQASQIRNIESGTNKHKPDKMWSTISLLQSSSTHMNIFLGYVKYQTRTSNATIIFHPKTRWHSVVANLHVTSRDDACPEPKNGWA